MRNPQTIRDLAQAFGVITDDMNEPAVREALDDLLTLLAKDASGDQDISDGHARFQEHVTVMVLFGDSDDAIQARIDNLTWTQLREANLLETEGIAWIRAHWLK